MSDSENKKIIVVQKLCKMINETKSNKKKKDFISSDNEKKNRKQMCIYFASILLKLMRLEI